MISMACNIAGVPFKNPIIMASGTFGFGREYAEFYSPELLGGIVGKGLTLHPKAGNTGSRIHETASGMLNSVGLENPGIAAFLKDELDDMTHWNTAVIANVGGSNLEEYVQAVAMITENAQKRRTMNRRGVDMLELNISCPNVKQGGMQFGIQTEVAREVVRQVRNVTALPLVVKLSPNAENITQMAVMCEEEGADGVSLINTFSAMKIDIRRRRSVFANTYAGLSGPAIKPIALRMVHQVAQAVSIPVIGMGGISSVEDIIEFTMAGAAAIQVGTYNFVHLHAGAELVHGLEQWMQREKVQSLDEIRGIL
ncbi:MULTISPECIES: dihydroorotate dehydrogenase [Paenibacillus]|uniref:dihydroorotate dehydrogenase n=1 Tax=Paenibacillus TaxID=44249 RepID=UPI00096CF7C3|nr:MULTISPECIES: dihydroorotate dehydrogenase [Paenibacillus]OMF49930.1 dihydroorotate dehydrogenase B catalytic subunit [Paenibacillus peoriae]QYK64746.1 Dihydroorotate dehydrogenase B (NAD(+)), catalytic subunit [Paenibacillus sp. S25]